MFTIIFIAAFLAVGHLTLIWRILMTQQDILAQIATINTDLDALIAAATPVDLQPIADALTALDAKVKAATPAPAP